MFTDTARLSVAFSLSGAVHVAVFSVIAPAVQLIPSPLSQPLQIQIIHASAPQSSGPISRMVSAEVPPNLATREQYKNPATRLAETFSSQLTPISMTRDLTHAQPDLQTPIDEKKSISQDASAAPASRGESSESAAQGASFSNNENTKKLADERFNSAPDRPLSTPSLAFSTPPEYPEEARWEKRHGRALLVFQLKPDGAVREIRLASSSGHDDLDAAAIQALQKWRFNVPAGAEASAWYKYALRFDLL